MPKNAKEKDEFKLLLKSMAKDMSKSENFNEAIAKVPLLF